MAMNYMPVPFEFLEEMEDLSDEEFGRLIRWGIRYQSTGEIVELIGMERVFRNRIKKQVDRYVANYEERMEKIREAGRKGGQKTASNRQAMLSDATAMTSGATKKVAMLSEAIAPCSESSQTKTETYNNTNTDIERKKEERKKFGAFVLLTTSEYGELLNELGYSEFLRCKAAVDLEENQGMDWASLIRAKHGEGMEL